MQYIKMKKCQSPRKRIFILKGTEFLETGKGKKTGEHYQKCGADGNDGAVYAVGKKMPASGDGKRYNGIPDQIGRNMSREEKSHSPQAELH